MGVRMTHSTTNRESNWKKWSALEFKNYSNEAYKIRAISFWALWYNRNRIYHERIRQRAHEIIGFINAYCSEITQMGEILKNMQETKRFVWEPHVDDDVTMAEEMGFRDICVEGDALTLSPDFVTLGLSDELEDFDKDWGLKGQKLVVHGYSVS
ncbi:hypothetical protein Gotri_025773 [Gossypium trilobum]|uniref:Uncharacterized protein n=1 Tax=Gossypium trilobum TaxID=34281 RepID=A0A7J9FKB7_9ROSI|nr:hypothetical protein [Gossypium trilobum]